MKKISVNHHGFSLVQVMIGFSLVGFLALVMLKINETGSKTSRTLEVRQDKNKWLGSITTQYIHDSASCLNNFGLAANGSQNNITNTTIANPITSLWDLNDATFVTTGDELFKGSLTLSKIELKPFQENSAGSSEGICPLELTFTGNTTTAGGENSKLFGAQISMTTINFYCSVNKADPGGTNDPIVNCMPSTSSVYNSLWDFTLISGSDFINWFPNSGLGSVVVGPLGATPSIDHTAALNLSKDGGDWSDDAAAGLHEGISFNSDSYLSLGSFYFLEDSNLFYGLYDDGTLIHAPLIFQPKFTTFNFFRSATTNRPHTVEVMGDIEGTQVALRSDENYVMLDFNRATRSLVDGSLSFLNTSGAGAIWALDQAAASEDLFLSLVDTSQAGLTVANIRTYEKWSINYLGMNRFFSSNTNTVDSTAQWSILAGRNNEMEAGTGFSFILGSSNTDIKKQFQFIVGDSNTSDSPHNFIIGNGNNIGTNAEGYNFILGSDNDIATGEKYNFIFGSDYTGASEIDQSFQFIFGKSKPGPTHDYQVKLGTGGVTTTRNLKFDYASAYSTAITPFTSQMSIYDDGGMFLTTAPEKIALSVSSPSKLFIGAPTDSGVLGSNNNSWSMISSNLYRQVAADGSVTYHKEDTLTNDFGFAAIFMSYKGVQFFVEAGAGAPTTTRSQEVLGAIPGGTDAFAISENSLSLDDLDMNNEDISFPDILSSPACPSDERLKSGIKIYQFSLLDMMKIKPVSFDWKSSNLPAMGFIAQDLKKINPEFVIRDKNQDGEKIYKVKITSLITALYSSILQIFERVNELLMRLTSYLGQIEKVDQNLLLNLKKNQILLNRLHQEKP